MRRHPTLRINHTTLTANEEHEWLTNRGWRRMATKKPTWTLEVMSTRDYEITIAMTTASLNAAHVGFSIKWS